MPITAEQARQIQKLSEDWTRHRVAEGVDGPVPLDRRGGRSDYNLHVPDIESSGVDMDKYHDRVRNILGLPPMP